MATVRDNAIAAIRMGVEDFASDDDERALSAIRNFYSGVLLLAKHALSTLAPGVPIEELIGAQYKPVPDDGGVKYVQKGSSTIDFQTIGERFKDFNAPIRPDVWKALQRLNKLRNEIEHHSPSEPENVVRDAIAEAFPAVIHFMQVAKLDPTELLPTAWPIVLEARNAFQAELARCQDTLKSVEWHSGVVGEKGLLCPDCSSPLVAQRSPDNTEQEEVELRCSACGKDLGLAEAIVRSLDEHLAGDAYLRVKEEGAGGPVWQCPECLSDAYVDYEESCAVCGHHIEAKDCLRCGTDIPLEERIDIGGDLCGYCAYMSEKIMRE